MKSRIKVAFILSGILPASVLMIMSLLIIIHIIIGDSLSSEEVLALFICILGILGYIGLFRLLSSHRYSSIEIIPFLLCGIFSFVIFNFNGPDNAWEWVFTMQEPGEWFILVWPTIVGIIGIIGLLIKEWILKKGA